MGKKKSPPSTSPKNLLKLIVALLPGELNSFEIQKRTGMSKHVLSNWRARRSDLIKRRTNEEWEKRGDPTHEYELQFERYMEDKLSTMNLSREEGKNVQVFFAENKAEIAGIMEKNLENLEEKLRERQVQEYFRKDPLSWVLVMVSEDKLFQSSEAAMRFLWNLTSKLYRDVLGMMLKTPFLDGNEREGMLDDFEKILGDSFKAILENPEFYGELERIKSDPKESRYLEKLIYLYVIDLDLRKELQESMNGNFEKE
ncbi:MAG: hypothetical protein ACFFD4_19690 [Candidatus Odinarchaeota archaeon]